MAFRPKGYGMTAELSRKIQEKYSIDDEQEVVSWICALVDVEAPPESGMKVCLYYLKKQHLLCCKK